MIYTSKYTVQLAHPSSIARVLVYPSVDSLEAIDGTCDQRKLWSDCVDADRTRFIIGLACAGSTTVDSRYLDLAYLE